MPPWLTNRISNPGQLPSVHMPKESERKRKRDSRKERERERGRERETLGKREF